MKNRYIIYIPLALLFVIAATYQARFIQGRIIYIQGKVDRVRPPLGTGRYNSTINYINPEAEQAGIHKGDQLIAVDGRTYTGPAPIWDRVYDGRPGDLIILTVRHQENEASQTEEIKQVELARAVPEPFDLWGLLYMLVLTMLLPVFCILLGFGVTLLRPRDHLAWLLLGYKQGTTAAPDARRRLRLLYIGTNISLAPSLIIFVLSLVRGTTPDKAAPPWIVIPGLLMFLLFPLTFAYVIVVHRALDIRVVIRQGVRYAFARGGVQALRFLVIGVIVFAMVRLIDRPESGLGENLTIIILGVAIIFVMRRCATFLTARLL